MENEFGIEQSKAFATGLFEGAKIVAQYMTDRHKLIADAKATREPVTKVDALRGCGFARSFGCKPSRS